jgi:iron complex outermembrane recepter protein
MARHLTGAIAAIALWPLSFQMASAQQAQTGPAPDQSTGLQEIVITAQRVEQTAQHAALAISTIAGSEIATANITRPEGLTNLVPSVQVADDTGPYSIFYIRGVGNFAANGLSDAAVAFNFDGVTVSRSDTSGFFYDVERVEVLKGPQGTLYGRNATGGAINVISKQPVLGELQGEASAEFGNYSTYREDGMINLPIGTTAAVRFAGFHVQHAGYMDDGTDSQDDIGGRLSFKFTPNDSLNVGVVGDYFKQGGDGSGGTVTGTTNAFFAAPTFTPSERLGFFSPQVEAFISTMPNVLNGRTMAPFQNVNYEDNRFFGVATTIDWRTPVGTVTLIPAYRESQLDYTSFATGVMLREQSEEKQTSIEARIASDNDRPFRYVAGVYYLNDPNYVPMYDVNQQSVANFQQYTAKTLSRAVFTNLTYAIVPAVRLVGGVRYTKDDKTFDGTAVSNSIICKRGFLACPNAGVFPYSQVAPVPPQFFNPNGTITTLTGIPASNAQSYGRVTWRAGAEWDVTDQNLLYANAGTGFKSGGFFFSSDTNFYQPESINAYTIGSKNRFLENRLQANLELYYWKYKNQQISHLSLDSLNQLIFPTENVGEATYKGFELDLEARPFKNTLLSTDVQYNDGVYDSFVYHTPNQNGGVGNGTGCPNVGTPGATYTVDCSGKQPPYAPLWTLTAGLQQTIDLPADAKLVGNAQVHYQTATLTALDFLPSEEQAGYAIWNFDLTYSTANDRFFVGGYIDNAFNKTALSFSFPTPLSTFMTATLQHPQTFGVRVGVHF